MISIPTVTIIGSFFVAKLKVKGFVALPSSISSRKLHSLAKECIFLFFLRVNLIRKGYGGSKEAVKSHSLISIF